MTQANFAKPNQVPALPADRTSHGSPLLSVLECRPLKHRERRGPCHVASWQHPRGQGSHLSKLHVFFMTLNYAFYTLTYLMLNLFK